MDEIERLRKLSDKDLIDEQLKIHREMAGGMNYYHVRGYSKQGYDEGYDEEALLDCAKRKIKIGLKL